MKRKFLAVLVVGMLSVCTVACGGEKQVFESENIEQPTPESEEVTEAGDLSELDALGDIEVDEGLFNVEITIPADYVGEATQEELTAKAEESGFKSITLNEDGSATYVMTKKQHKEMLDEIATSINGSLDEMVTGDDYSFTAIEANDNFTDFKVTTTATELGLADSMSVLGFYMYGGMYSIFSGEEVDNIHVTFINADSGEVISESNSKDIAE